MDDHNMYKLYSKYSFVYTSNSIHFNYNHQKSVTCKKYWDPKRKHSSQVALIIHLQQRFFTSVIHTNWTSQIRLHSLLELKQLILRNHRFISQNIRRYLYVTLDFSNNLGQNQLPLFFFPINQIRIFGFLKFEVFSTVFLDGVREL